MSHHIYTTPGFIVHSSSQGEAGKYLLLFTRDLGMIGATAQGVRLQQSKLRYYLQDFSYSIFSVVRGKEVWRVTGAKEIEDMNKSVHEMNPENKKLYVRILSLLKRLLHGEEKNERLFRVLENFHHYVSTKDLDKEKRELVEYLVVFRILDSLGYVHAQSPLEILCDSDEIREDILEKVKSHTKSIVEEINNGLKESQL